jgi:hypothetical protein
MTKRLEQAAELLDDAERHLRDCERDVAAASTYVKRTT